LTKETENKVKVRELIAQAEQIKLGGELKAGVFIDYTSDFGTIFQGNVIFKRPTMMEYVRIGALKSEYLRKAGVVDPKLVDNLIKLMAHIMSTLNVVIIQSPEWLINLENIQEPDILYHVYEKYEEWEKSFRKIPTEQVPTDSESPEGAGTLDT